MGNLILLRHGTSTWNVTNRFTGWKDIPLAPKGQQEALVAGQEMREKHAIALENTHIMTSTLIRAQETARLVMQAYQQKPRSYTIFDELKERDYGSLTGMNKQDVEETYGKDLFQKWRRSYDVPPPDGESLKQVVQRVKPLLGKTILPYLRERADVLIVAHGNSLRALMMVIKKMTAEEIVHFVVPNAQCIILADLNLEDDHIPHE